jgi:hypothetical protein
VCGVGAKGNDTMTRFSSTHLSTRGHGPKLNEIVDALNAKGMLPPGLRPVELGRRIFDEGVARGYDPNKGEIPSRTTIGRSVKIIDYSV